MPTRAQEARAWAKGTKAALERRKDQGITLLEIRHPSRVSSAQVSQTVETVLYNSGLDAATCPIRIVTNNADAEETLRELQERFTLVMQANQRLTQENQQLKEAASIPPETPVAAPLKWVTVAEAARYNETSDNSIYRAIEEGRIQARSTPVNTKSNHWVIAETFTRKTRKKRSPNKKKKS